MDTLRADLVYALRSLRKNSSLTLIAVLTLALGIGATTALFSIVDAVLIQPLPYPEPNQLVRMFAEKPDQNISGVGMSQADVYDLRERAESFSYIGVQSYFGLALTGQDRPMELSTVLVSPGLLDQLGVSPLHGRLFHREEELPGKGQVVLLGHGFWQRQFGGDPSIVDQTINLDNRDYLVAGVLPPDVDFPEQDVDLYSTYSMDPERLRRSGRSLITIARLEDGVTLESAQAELDTLTAALAEEHPKTNEGWSANLVQAHDNVVSSVRPALWTLLGATLLVLLIACVNVANLMLARGATRRREVALRAAFGASRWRLVRLVLTESLVLAVVGGGLGILLALWGIDLLLATAPQLPRAHEVGIDSRVLLFALGMSLLASLFFGLVPALQSSRQDLNETLRGNDRAVQGDRQSLRSRSVLAVTQVALSLLLLIGAGLMLRSFTKLISQDPGYDAEQVLALQVFAYGENFAQPGQQQAFAEQVIERLRNLPGISAAGVTSGLPLSVIGNNSLPIHVEGRAEAEREELGQSVADPGYFETMQLDLRRGRLFEDGDRQGAPLVAVINEEAERRFFADQDPLGQRIINLTEDSPVTIVGVVEDVRQDSMLEPPEPQVYLPFAQFPTGTQALVVRATGDPADVLKLAQDQVWAVAPQQPIWRAPLLRDLMQGATASPRFYALLTSLFAGLALVLASIGLFGVMAYSVNQRTQEIGVRMAIGARHRDVLRMILGQSTRLVLGGVALGLAAAWAVSHLARATLSSLLFEIQTTDLVSFASMTLLLILVAFLACWIPARRATRVDPVEALRSE